MTEIPATFGSALKGARVVLGVSGGIASYKAVEVARALIKAGADVQVVMTEAATRFVGTITFASLTGKPVYTSVFDAPERIIHVRLGREADVVIVAPATANIIAKMATGLADDLLSNVLLAAQCPIVVAPAMHTEMWQHEATQDNVATLYDRDVLVVEPEHGMLAGGDDGIGRLAEAGAIYAAIASRLQSRKTWVGVRVLVSAAGTREPIDPIRYIGNRASGKMGFALARQARYRGADVTLVTGPTALLAPVGVEVVRVETASQMRDAVLARFDGADVVIKAAAVGDFRPADPHPSKLHKDAGPPRITLEPTVDILAEIGRAKTNQILVGFKAETDDAVARGRKMLAAKNLDLVVVNQVGAPDSGFETDTNRAILLAADGDEVDLPLQSKTQLAGVILDHVRRLLVARGPS